MDVTIDINKIIARVRESFTAPTKLLKSAKSEKGWQEALVYLAILSLVGTVLTVFYSLVIFPLLQPVLKTTFSSFGVSAGSYTLAQILPAAAISLVVAVALNFVYAFFFKLWVNFFGAESKYDEAYRLLVYARTPSYVLGWFPFVNALAGLYSLVLLFKGLKVFYGFTNRRATSALLLGVLILLIINFAVFALLVNYS